MDSDLVVEIRDATIGYSSNEPLLSSINLKFSKGEIVAIAGPSGIGKTTLLRTIAGLVPPFHKWEEKCCKRTIRIYPSKTGFS